MGLRTALAAAVVVVALLAPTVLSTESASDARRWSTVPRGPYAILPATPENFTASDGTHISYAVHMPAVPAGTKVPVILSAGPYFALLEEPVHVPSSQRLTGFLVDNYVPHGYAVVAASVRGTGWSGGCMELMSEREGRDIDELVTFLATRGWSNGNVALTGKSYDGGVAWNVARFGNPALKTIVPVASITDLGDLSVHHGVAQFRTPVMGNAQYGLYGLGLELGSFLGGPSNEGRALEDRVAGAVCPEIAKSLAIGPYSSVTGDIRTTPGVADYWAERNYRPGVLANYKGSVFVVHGLQDFNVNPHMVAPFFSELPQEKKMWLGQWAHHYADEGATTNRDDFARVLKAWLDRYLKGADVATGPVVEVADGATRAWRALPDWPMPPTSERAFTLRGDGTMAPGPAEPFATPITTPLGAYVLGGGPCSAPNPGQLFGVVPWPPQAGPARFRSAPVAQAFRFSGVGTVDVTVDPATPGALMSFLCVDNVIVAHGATHTLYADASNDLQPFVPGLPLTVRVEFEPAEHTVPAGARLTLVLRSEGYLNDYEGGYYWPGASAGVMRVTAGELTLPVH